MHTTRNAKLVPRRIGAVVVTRNEHQHRATRRYRGVMPIWTPQHALAQRTLDNRRDRFNRF
jgi:hypothetical protein